MTLRRLALGAIAAVLPSACGPAAAATAHFHCTNPASGARWDIVVDYGRRLADSFPAEITRERISWHDTRHGGLYELDRSSGALTVRFASSTGGYFLRDRCALAPGSR